jgi:hypothetical protein
MTDRCEPPPELRQFGVWHWLEYREPPYTFARWDHDGWWLPEDQNVCPSDGMSEHWRYIAPIASPEEVEALRAEVERLNHEVQNLLNRNLQLREALYGLLAQVTWDGSAVVAVRAALEETK